MDDQGCNCVAIVISLGAKKFSIKRNAIWNNITMYGWLFPTVYCISPLYYECKTRASEG